MAPWPAKPTSSLPSSSFLYTRSSLSLLSPALFFPSFSHFYFISVHTIFPFAIVSAPEFSHSHSFPSLLALFLYHYLSWLVLYYSLEITFPSGYGYTKINWQESGEPARSSVEFLALLCAKNELREAMRVNEVSSFRLVADSLFHSFFFSFFFPFMPYDITSFLYYSSKEGCSDLYQPNEIS